MRRQLRLLGVSQIPGGHLNWSHIAQLSMSAWHASGGIQVSKPDGIYSFG